MKISPARVAAFDVLSRIETEGSFSSALLPIYEEPLSAPDRGLCHQLVMGVLRKQMYIDRLIEHFSTKKLDTAVRIALRLGFYQLLFLERVPAYSAINESVNLVQRAKKTSAKGFVNAILRKVSASTPTLQYADEVERISVETSHPRWLLEKWTTDFGAVEAENIATANNLVPRTAFRLTRKGRASEIAASHPRSEFVDGCYFSDSLDERLLNAAEAGDIYVQDEASQLVADVVIKTGGNEILDVCAAPGGKTSQIAEAREGARIVAGDLHSSRVRLLRSTCNKQGVGAVEVVQYDAARSLPFENETFDTVVVDAPCSGTGTIRHNPEIRYFLTENDLVELPSKQLAILRNASKLVRKGGRLVYSTCSLQVEENEGVCRSFLDGDADFRLKTSTIADRFVTAEGFARTFPHRDGMDGFFIAEFEKTR